MALEHHGMSESVYRALDVGNKVRTKYEICEIKNIALYIYLN